jgi:Golgi nucleoside diphosphatase
MTGSGLSRKTPQSTDEQEEARVFTPDDTKKPDFQSLNKRPQTSRRHPIKRTLDPGFANHSIVNGDA